MCAQVQGGQSRYFRPEVRGLDKKVSCIGWVISDPCVSWLSFNRCLLCSIWRGAQVTEKLYRYDKPEMRSTKAGFNRRPDRQKGGDPLGLSYL